MTQPAPAKFPMADLKMDEKTAIYVGVMERQMMLDQRLLIQYRALLEALTGEKWEEIDTRLSADGVKKTAASAFERRMARQMKAAERTAMDVVEANIAAANEKA